MSTWLLLPGSTGLLTLAFMFHAGAAADVAPQEKAVEEAPRSDAPAVPDILMPAPAPRIPATPAPLLPEAPVPLPPAPLLPAAPAPLLPGADIPVPPPTTVPPEFLPETRPPASVDPTRPSSELRQLLESELPPAAGRQAPTQIPEVNLKARMVSGGVAEALLEIDGRLYRVSEGDEVVIASPRGVLTLNVLELNGHLVRLEIPSLPGNLVHW